MNSTQRSVIHSSFSARNVRSLDKFNVEEFASLNRIGISLDRKQLDNMVAMAMDAIQPSITTGSMTTPVQFLQNWLPGFVKILTAARKIDELVGIMTVGSWEDEQVVQGILELLGTSVPYGDYTNVPFSSWNANYAYRTVVRFEEGMRIGLLDELRAGRVNINAAAEYRESAALALEIIRNTLGFYGYNSGNNNTYGFLNDPGLPSYVTAANGASGSPLWSRKTFLEITADIRSMIVGLRSSSQDQIDPENTNITLGVATAAVDFLTVTSDFGISVRDWLTKTYPRVRVVSAPELTAANGGANVAYMFAEKVNDLSTDGGNTFIQMIPAKFRLLGVEKKAKATIEDYSNASAGVMCKRPFAVYRLTGI